MYATVRGLLENRGPAWSVNSATSAKTSGDEDPLCDEDVGDEDVGDEDFLCDEDVGDKDVGDEDPLCDEDVGDEDVGCRRRR